MSETIHFFFILHTPIPLLLAEIGLFVMILLSLFIFALFGLLLLIFNIEISLLLLS